MKLLLDETVLLDSTPVLGDISKENCKTLDRGERVDCKPALAGWAERFKRERTVLRHCLSKPREVLCVSSIDMGVLQLHSQELTPVGDLRPVSLIDEAHPPRPIDDDHTI